MKRLVYAPKINAYIKADSGIHDVSEYITDFSIDRKVNQVSTAQLTLRNPDKKWTNSSYVDLSTGERKVGPVFHPMDPITIMLTRLQNRPVQVFTGYCDSTPYLQLFPGTVQIRASCTLKKLLYTFFDPGLPFMREFLTQYGWTPTGNGSIVNPTAEIARSRDSIQPRGDDSGIGELLYHVLHEIGGWPEDAIYIEKMPESIVNLVSNLFDLFKSDAEESSEDLRKLLRRIIGTAELGGGAPGPVGNAGGAGPKPKSVVTPVDVGRAMLTAKFPADREVLARGMAVIQVESDFGAYAPMCWVPNSAGCCGYWQLQLATHGVTVDEANDLIISTQKAKPLWDACGGSFECDWYAWEADASDEAQQYHSYLSKADKAIELGPFA